ncbi:MAG: TIGR04255 family protein [Oligoflexia bacterium]|nr:TIGR04255 family protein [Oligoflexia bacterium]
MPFPDTPRICYQKNPLDEVICQLRFPRALRAETDVPVAFQESIRELFPAYSERAVVGSVPGMPAELAKLMGVSGQKGAAKREHVFTSEDGKMVVVVGTGFIALTDYNYSEWSNFAATLEQTAGAFLEEYSIPYFSRVGLRYIDVIRPTVLGIKQGGGWHRLLSRGFAGEIADQSIGPSVVGANRNTIVQLQGCKGRVRIQHGLGEDPGTKDIVYVIDSDFFDDSEHRSLEGALELLGEYNVRAGRLFRWATSDELKTALGVRGDAK